MTTQKSKKIALVTGGSRGIGAAISLELASPDFLVIVNYNNSKSHADLIVDAIIKKGGEAIAVQANIAEENECKKMFEEIEQSVGSVDVLINNAGITRDKSFRKMELSEWNEVINTNLSSAFNTCKLALPSMIENKYGRIININNL